MKTSRLILTSLVICSIFCSSCATPQDQRKVWEKVEIELIAENTYSNPYTDVEVWLDLKGPGFSERCYGFWDEENTWKIRVMATKAGKWTWISGSNQKDKGLNKLNGSFLAEEWTEAEKKENPLRRAIS